MGVMAAFIFAAQMINFPIIGGTSGHLIGGVLAAVMLGPWAASIIMTTILALQALIFLDGGITALGANILNMAVIAVFAGYGIYLLIQRVWPNRTGTLVGTFVASWASVVLAAFACAIELALSGMAPFNVVVTAMLGWHVVIGLGGGDCDCCCRLPDTGAWIWSPAPTECCSEYDAQRNMVFVDTGGSFGCFLSPFASSLPDGLEKVAEDYRFIDQGEEVVSLPCLITRCLGWP